MSDLEANDQKAAAEVIKHLTTEQPAPDVLPMPIQPIDQAQRPAPPISKPVVVVDIDEAIAPSQAVIKHRASFFCGEVGMLRLPDGRQLHVKSHHINTSDTDTIAILTEASTNPSHRVFLQPH